MSNKKTFAFVFVSILWLCGCTQAQQPKPAIQSETKPETTVKIKNEARVIHVLVALCDNENQGIVPVPASLGNGDDPQTNLYWGAAFGVKTFFGKSANWTKLSETNDPKANVLQRIVFKHKRQNVYLIADAYRGIKMKETVDDFFSAVSGEKLENIKIGDLTLQILGSANLVAAFVGHNGLMDFDLKTSPQKNDDEKRDAVILACASRQYFAAHLKKTRANPLLWTSNLMAPEAYILHDALDGWIAGETAQQIRTRGAAAYAKYQKISQRSAENLLVTGW